MTLVLLNHCFWSLDETFLWHCNVYLEVLQKKQTLFFLLLPSIPCPGQGCPSPEWLQHSGNVLSSQCIACVSIYTLICVAGMVGSCQVSAQGWEPAKVTSGSGQHRAPWAAPALLGTASVERRAGRLGAVGKC